MNEMLINPYQLLVAFLLETSYLFRGSKKMTGFDMKCSTGLR